MCTICNGFVSTALSATVMTTPSVASAAFSAIIAPDAKPFSSRSARAPLLLSSRISRNVCKRPPASSFAACDSDGAKTPSTSTRRYASTVETAFSAASPRFSAEASGAAASGCTSRISARKSVYFQSSRRRCGRPARSKASKARWRVSATLPAPGKRSRTEVKISLTTRVSLLVWLLANTTFIPKSVTQTSGRVVELGVAGRLQLQRQLLAAAFHDPALRHHVNKVRHDVIQKPLIVRDHHHRPARRTQRVDAVSGNPQRIDVETGIHFVKDAKARLEQRHLKNFVALLLAAGEADVDAALEHVLRDVQPLGDLAHFLQELRRHQFALATRLALGIVGRAQE